jgi:hypothetical protein
MGSKEPWNVLEEAPRRPECLGDANDFPEEPAPLAGKPDPPTGDAEILTGEAADEEINAFMPVVALPFSDISRAGNVWPVLGEDSAAEWVKFDLFDALMPCALQSEVEIRRRPRRG